VTVALSADVFPFGLPRWTTTRKVAAIIAVTEDPELTNRERDLLVFLINRANGRGQSWWSVDRMAEHFRLNPSTIQRARRGLVAKGRIRFEAQHEPNGFQKSNRYTLTIGSSAKPVSPGNQGVASMTPRSDVPPPEKRLKRVSPGNQGVASVPPKVVSSRTRDVATKSNVPVLISSRQRGKTQNGQTKPTTLDLDEFRTRKPKTKKAQDATRLDGGASRPCAKDKPMSWQPACGHRQSRYDFQCRGCTNEAQRHMECDDWEGPSREYDPLEEQIWADIEATIGPLEPKVYTIRIR
jgi:hypothetical protein